MGLYVISQALADEHAVRVAEEDRHCLLAIERRLNTATEAVATFAYVWFGGAGWMHGVTIATPAVGCVRQLALEAPVFSVTSVPSAVPHSVSSGGGDGGGGGNATLTVAGVDT